MADSKEIARLKSVSTFKLFKFHIQIIEIMNICILLLYEFKVSTWSTILRRVLDWNPQCGSTEYLVCLRARWIYYFASYSDT